MACEGTIVNVAGPAVVAAGMADCRMHDRVVVGDAGLMGEIIRLERDRVTIQVYEDTTGLRLGEKVVGAGEPLVVELGPGLLGSVFDGIQRPLEAIRAAQGDFIGRGIAAPALPRDRQWLFRPCVSVGEPVAPGDIVGRIDETPGIEHRVMAPAGVSGRIGQVREGPLTVTEPAAFLEDGTAIPILQHWPVRTPRRFAARLPSTVPFITGQRVFDVLFPLALGGSAILPGGFGTGKTVVEQTLARYAAADVIVFVGCGERGNEMTEVLSDFPALSDPSTGRPLMERTVLVVNTSNMPVAAREASIYTGITIAEYYRDMGYRVALMADSISRWAEALREISSRLEEMTGEEGYPTYLSTRQAKFYERGGRVTCLGKEGREGAVTIVASVSPPGGDFSEPVTQGAQRLAGVFWALDPELAHQRHFPAVNWRKSYSLYRDSLDSWFSENVSPEWAALRGELMRLLQREEELQEIVQLVGIEALQDEERLLLTASRMIREEFLRQSVFSPNEAVCPPEKAFLMLKAFLAWHDACRREVAAGVPADTVLARPLRAEVVLLREAPAEDFAARAGALLARIAQEGREAP